MNIYLPKNNRVIIPITDNFWDRMLDVCKKDMNTVSIHHSNYLEERELNDFIFFLNISLNEIDNYITYFISMDYDGENSIVLPPVLFEDKMRHLFKIAKDTLQINKSRPREPTALADFASILRHFFEHLDSLYNVKKNNGKLQKELCVLYESVLSAIMKLDNTDLFSIQMDEIASAIASYKQKYKKTSSNTIEGFDFSN